MKEFLQILRRFVPPYKKYLGLSILFNILSAVLNIFSFAALIPILQILFQVDGGIRVNEYMHWNGDWGSIKEVATNNLYYYIQEFIVVHSASTALLVIGIFLAFMTFLKTGAYFLSSATIIPIRTGIVRDIRNQIYQKINSLCGFFSGFRRARFVCFAHIRREIRFPLFFHVKSVAFGAVFVFRVSCELALNDFRFLTHF